PDVHGQIDGAAAALPGARVIPLDAGRHDLELATSRADVPATAPGILDRLEGRIGLAVYRKQRQGGIAWRLPKLRQCGCTERLAHGSSPLNPRAPPHTPPRYSPLIEAGATWKDAV